MVMFSAIITTMVKKFNVWESNCVLEATFIEQHITPITQEVFARHSISMRLGESHVAGDAHGLMADYIGSHTTTTGAKYDLLVVEVKPPAKSSRNQLQSDFVKLGKEMKDIIDALIDFGVEAPCACGILVEGFAVKTYSMQLKCEGVYVMLHHESVRLLETPEDVHSLPAIVECFVQLKNIVQPTIKRIDEIALSSEPSHGAPASWKRRSAGIPMRTAERREDI
ncbi:hypothetical protein BJV82DRAFT_626136 [Fennellomyces sp. T-0311]|nr:hypothetical protein BJV82DRAFT_626136 [Fennellomyces sp. T-0311]